MKKLVGVVTSLAMLLPVAASAAVISNPLFSNGDVTIDARGGSTVSGTFTLQVNANEVCEVLRTQSDTQPFTDANVGGPKGYEYGTYTGVPFSVKANPNTGTYNATAQCAGIWGGNHSVDGADNVVVGPTNLGTIRVTADSTGSTGGSSSGGGFGFASFADLVAALKLALGIGTTTTSGSSAPTSACAQLNSYSSFSYGDTGNVVKTAQLYVMSHGGSIAAGATGFWGNQSAGALVSAKSANNCN